MVDVSYPLSMNMAIYPGNPSFSIQRVQSFEAGDSVNVSEIAMGTHTGTHVDAPAHFIEGGETLDEVSLDRMNGRAKVFDVTGHDDIDTSVLDGLDIDAGDIVLFKTDNSLHWSCDTILDEYVTLTYDGARYLADSRVCLVGVDYLTIERPRKKRQSDRSVHQILLGNGVLICEGLRLRGIDEGKYIFRCLPLNIIGADGCPVRAVIEDEYFSD